ncbi:TPA: hypothetical protein DCQ44_00070 [Candidatus Taylorbacteria bacterium]|nr:hypothetical protein [Candidatus Taylorbacteria bacterium]
MKRNLKYRPLPVYGLKEEVLKILEKGDKKDLMLLALSVGESFPDWQYAQEVCLGLAESEDEDIRANACQGLSYVARTKLNLDRNIVEPVLLRELETQIKNKWIITNAIDDVNYYLKWNIK